MLILGFYLYACLETIVYTPTMIELDIKQFEVIKT